MARSGALSEPRHGPASLPRRSRSLCSVILDPAASPWRSPIGSAGDRVGKVRGREHLSAWAGVPGRLRVRASASVRGIVPGGVFVRGTCGSAFSRRFVIVGVCASLSMFVSQVCRKVVAGVSDCHCGIQPLSRVGCDLCQAGQWAAEGGTQECERSLLQLSGLRCRLSLPA